MQWDSLFALIIAVVLFFLALNPQIIIKCPSLPPECVLGWDYLFCLAGYAELQAEQWVCAKLQFMFGAFAALGGLFALLMSIVGAVTK